MITISQDLSVQDLCPIACVKQKRSGGHEVMFVLHLPCKIDVHVPRLPHGITHLRCARPWGNHDHFKSTQSTHATQNNQNILAAGMHNPCKASQLNHIDRCDPTLHTLPVFPSPRPRSLENYFAEKYLKRM